MIYFIADLMDVAEVQLKMPRELDEIVEGVDVSFKCSIDGNPEPQIVFYRNKNRLVFLSNFKDKFCAWNRDEAVLSLTRS
jgi:hypothetical protein